MRINIRSIGLLALGAVFLLLGLQVCEAERKLDPVKVRLLADHSAVLPGSVFRLGVLFDVEPGWHIYWKYPGEAGLPTVPGFELPNGFTSAGLNWPIPDRFMQGPNLPGFGYHNQLLLATDVTVPSDANGTAELKAKVRWLGCSDVCVPGRKELALIVKIGQPIASESELFQEWNSRYPLVEATNTSLLESSFKVLSEEGDAIKGVLEIQWHQKVEDVDWFQAPRSPMEVRDVKISAIDSTSSAGVTKIHFSLFHPKGSAEIKELDSLLVYKKNGHRSGVSIPIKIAN